MKLDALDGPVNKKDAKVFLEQHPVKRTFFNPSKDIISGIAVLGIFAFIMIYAMTKVGDAGTVFNVAMIAVILIALPVYLYFHHIFAVKNAEIGLRVERMAQDNGLQYEHRMIEIKPPTTFFVAGRDYEFTNVVKGPDFEAGQFQYTVGSGKNEKVVRYGYMIVPLQRSLPHMLLDGKSNNFRAFGMDISNVPATFDNDQIDQLEGDFSDHYKLYAPEGYGIDVRYIFTPDLMQILVEESDSIDIEIMEKNVFVYFGNRDVDSKQFWQKVDRLRQAFKDKLVTKSIRYQDDRTVTGAVAIEGRRLKTRVSIVAVVFVVVVVVLNFLDFFLTITDGR